jgi:hypothetical protein
VHVRIIEPRHDKVTIEIDDLSVSPFQPHHLIARPDRKEAVTAYC